jgi:hypothetical protein
MYFTGETQDYAGRYRSKADYDELASEFAAMRSDRDYHRTATMAQSEHWRSHYEARVQALEAELERYKHALWEANGYRIQEGKEPVKLTYSQSHQTEPEG